MKHQHAERSISMRVCVRVCVCVQDKQSFQAPAGYGGKAAAGTAGQGPAGGSAFQVVASSAAGSAHGEQSRGQRNSAE
eukprot:1160535-Pelagomonas_calceolata.AAC.11